MSEATLGLNAPQGSSFSDVLYRLTKLHVFSPAAREYRHRHAQALRELQAMSADELAEFGFLYCDIGRIAREMAHQHN